MRCPVRMHKAEKYAVHRRYVEETDRTFLMQNFGCARKVYNLYVDFLYRYLEENGYTGGAPIPGIRYPEVSEFKKEYPYLKEADSLGLANAKIAFGKAVERYNREYDHVTYTKGAKRRSGSGTEPLTFRGLAGMPKFHSRNRGDYSYTTNCQYPGEGKKLARPTVRLEGDRLYVPKRKEGMRLGRKLHDNGFGMFRETLSRKLEEKGSMLVKVGRYYASTKTCSTCGRVNEEVGLDVREWDCPVCGAHHDRDINAAVNICHEGRRILMDEYSQWLQSDEEAREKAAARSEWRRRKRSVLDSSKKSSTGLMQQSEKTIIRK